MYKKWKILKTELSEKQEEYSKVADWCNDNQEYHIESKGDYYHVVKNAEPTKKELNEIEVINLKQYLKDTDYIIIKIAEGVATAEEYADVIALRQQSRARINELEK